jgi:hypothetical protein
VLRNAKVRARRICFPYSVSSTAFHLRISPPSDYLTVVRWLAGCWCWIAQHGERPEDPYEKILIPARIAPSEVISITDCARSEDDTCPSPPLRTERAGKAVLPKAQYLPSRGIEAEGKSPSLADMSLSYEFHSEFLAYKQDSGQSIAAVVLTKGKNKTMKRITAVLSPSCSSGNRTPSSGRPTGCRR